jgi:3-hydroxybutyryl-CoA dehydrogenase
MDELGDCDLVIESAVRERRGQAQDFRRAAPGAEAGRHRRLQHLVDLDHAASPRSTDRPERFIGIHFMNPVPLMELVD